MSMKRTVTSKQRPGTTREEAPLDERILWYGFVKIGDRDRGKPRNGVDPRLFWKGQYGRPHERGMLTISEAVCDLTGLVPGVRAEVWVTGDGVLHACLVPGQEAIVDSWRARRREAIAQAQYRLARSVEYMKALRGELRSPR